MKEEEDSIKYLLTYLDIFDFCFVFRLVNFIESAPMEPNNKFSNLISNKALSS